MNKPFINQNNFKSDIETYQIIKAIGFEDVLYPQMNEAIDWNFIKIEGEKYARQIASLIKTLVKKGSKALYKQMKLAVINTHRYIQENKQPYNKQNIILGLKSLVWMLAFLALEYGDNGVLTNKNYEDYNFQYKNGTLVVNDNGKVKEITIQNGKPTISPQQQKEKADEMFPQIQEKLSPIIARKEGQKIPEYHGSPEIQRAIANFEGFVDHIYDTKHPNRKVTDADMKTSKDLTIGYGHKLTHLEKRRWKANKKISEAEAYQLFLKDFKENESEAISHLKKLPFYNQVIFSQGFVDGIISLKYNLSPQSAFGRAPWIKKDENTFWGRFKNCRLNKDKTAINYNDFVYALQPVKSLFNPNNKRAEKGLRARRAVEYQIMMQPFGEVNPSIYNLKPTLNENIEGATHRASSKNIENDAANIPIPFEDELVYNLSKHCNNGEPLTFQQAREMTTLPDIFHITNISSFNELKYFTSLSTIGHSAFYGCTGLTSINIPNSVTTIEDEAFRQCTSLTSIIIPNSVTTIGECAFFNCYNLTSINIPNSVTTIKDFTFYGCYNLTNINIPNSVTDIGDEAFESCTGLTSIILPERFKGHKRRLGIPTKTKVKYRPDTLDESVLNESPRNATRRENAKQIEDDSNYLPIPIPFKDELVYELFKHCNNGEPLTFQQAREMNELPDIFGRTHITTFNELKYFTSLTTIGRRTFEYCLELTSINIPNNVTSIGDNAFWCCWNLENINIPNSVTTIGRNAFDYCRSLTSINIPNSVTTIGNAAISGCRSLTSINIPNSVTTIGEKAFAYCESLTSVAIPNSVTTIGNAAFYGCTSLTSLILPERFKGQEERLIIPRKTKIEYRPDTLDESVLNESPRNATRRENAKHIEDEAASIAHPYSSYLLQHLKENRKQPISDRYQWKEIEIYEYTLGELENYEIPFNLNVYKPSENENIETIKWDDETMKQRAPIYINKKIIPRAFLIFDRCWEDEPIIQLVMFVNLPDGFLVAESNLSTSTLNSAIENDDMDYMLDLLREFHDDVRRITNYNIHKWIFQFAADVDKIYSDLPESLLDVIQQANYCWDIISHSEKTL